MKKNIVLKGRAVYAEVVLAAGVDQPQMNKRNDPYYTYAYGGTAFTVTEAIHTAYQNADLAELTLTTGSRMVFDVNPETGEDLDTQHEVNTLNYTGSLTYTQAKNIAKNEFSVIGAQFSAAKELGISADELSALLGAGSPKATVVTEEVNAEADLATA